MKQKQSKPLLMSLVSRFLPSTTYDERLLTLEKAGFNLFNLSSTKISGGDYLTDSGTGGLLDSQRAAMELADESYAGSTSYQKFENIFKQTTGFKYIFPVHQGRAAEKVLFGSVLDKNSVVFSNALFDTTRAHVEHTGAIGIDLVTPESMDIGAPHLFKGNINLQELEKQIPLALKNNKNVSLCVITVTNNTGGGQPVSLSNIREAKKILDKYKIPLIIDACRIAENAYFIQQLEEKNKSIQSIVQEIFSYADGFTMSAKKDGIANMGGVLGFNNPKWADMVKPSVILNEGFLNYGGISGRDMEVVAEGFKIAMTEKYLEHRIAQTRYLFNQLKKNEIPLVEPCGGHAVYINASKILPHIPPHEFPGQALACALYIIAGVRSCEMGSIMFGRYDDPNDTKKLTTPHRYELVRFAIPRLTYSNEVLDVVVDALRRIKKQPQIIHGMMFAEKPAVLPHFSATFKPKRAFDLIDLLND